MSIRNIITLLLISLGMSATGGQSYATNSRIEYVIEPPQDWVDLISDDAHLPTPNQETPHDVLYQLVDKQTKIQGNTIYSFVHVVKKIMNRKGIRKTAHIEFEYKPSCESLSLHHITIRRGQNVIHQLSYDKIRVIQREKGLEKGRYTGKKSILVFLEDIRVGDVIEYSFTRKNTCPINKLSIFLQIYFSTHQSRPISHLRSSILWPKKRPLSIKGYSISYQPEIQQDHNYTKYIWTAKNLPVDPEKLPQTAACSPSHPIIELGDHLSWKDVNVSLSKLYHGQQTLSATLQKHINEIAQHSLDEGQRFLSVMRFVQDEVRYMVVYEHPNSNFRPTEAPQTFSRRFGDCKDKTCLAITMLKALGIEAYSALVHSSSGQSLDQRLPSHAIFNHVIVVAIINNISYWIDPTYPSKGETLQNCAQPDYGYALILDGKTDSLTKMPPRMNGAKS
jgi:transglutaminase-like putative cysteine protease